MKVKTFCSQNVDSKQYRITTMQTKNRAVVWMMT